MNSTLCAATFSDSYVKWHLHYLMLRFVAVPHEHPFGDTSAGDTPFGIPKCAYWLETNNNKKVLSLCLVHIPANCRGQTWPWSRCGLGQGEESRRWFLHPPTSWNRFTNKPYRRRICDTNVFIITWPQCLANQQQHKRQQPQTFLCAYTYSLAETALICRGAFRSLSRLIGENSPQGSRPVFEPGT